MPAIDWEAFANERELSATHLKIWARDIVYSATITLVMGWWLASFAVADLRPDHDMLDGWQVARWLCLLSGWKFSYNLVKESGQQLLGRGLNLPPGIPTEGKRIPLYLNAIVRTLVFMGNVSWEVSERWTHHHETSRQVFQYYASMLVISSILLDHVDMERYLSNTAYKMPSGLRWASMLTLMAYAVLDYGAVLVGLETGVESDQQIALSRLLAAVCCFASFAFSIRPLFAVAKTIEEVETSGDSPYEGLQLMCQSDDFMASLNAQARDFLRQNGLLDRVEAVIGHDGVSEEWTELQCGIGWSAPLIPVTIQRRLVNEEGDEPAKLVAEKGVYDLAAIANWQQRSGTSPITRQPFTLDNLYVDTEAFEAMMTKAEQAKQPAPALISHPR